MKAEGVAGGSSALLLPSAWSGTAVGEGGGAVAAPASAGPAPSLCPGLVGCLRLRRQLRLAAKMVAISHTFPHTSPKWENEPLQKVTEMRRYSKCVFGMCMGAAYLHIERIHFE
eukprot:COSAG05_NODE_533_length_8896_cov_17.527404_6_plen_114_part_00